MPFNGATDALDARDILRSVRSRARPLCYPPRPVNESLIEVPDAVKPGPGLSPWTHRTAEAMAEALYATHDGPPSRDRLARMSADLDDFARRAGPSARRSLWLCLLAVSLMVPMFLRRLTSFASLSLDDRIEGLSRMEASPLGVAFFGAKAILCIVWYEQPEGAAHVGYDAQCLSAVRRAKHGDALPLEAPR